MCVCARARVCVCVLTRKELMTTKLPNPHYSPETCVKVTLLNFTVNASGLEDQILGLVVGKERPDLQEAKNQLVVSMANMKKTQKELEDKILKVRNRVTTSRHP